MFARLKIEFRAIPLAFIACFTLMIPTQGIQAQTRTPASTPSSTPHLAELYVTLAQARATAPKQANGAAYLQLENRGKTADKLLRISSSVATEVQLHTMSMDGDMMKMRPLDNISLPAASKLAMVPGNGPHVMLVGLKQALQTGQTIPMTLVFEKAGKLDIQVTVSAVK